MSVRIATPKSAEKIEASSGNVFADLGLPDAAELDTKVRLAVAINRQLQARRLTQAAAAAALSINQPKVSALKHYKLEGFSVERLMTLLTELGGDIEIRIRPGKAGRVADIRPLRVETAVGSLSARPRPADPKKDS
jgi:predicted XRE-type DNA-binding protein